MLIFRTIKVQIRCTKVCSNILACNYINSHYIDIIFPLSQFIFHCLIPISRTIGDQYVEEKNDLQLSLLITRAPINNSNQNRKIFLFFNMRQTCP